ncbi:CCA tRNA nucleotidyltransferase [Candidatus Fermentibacterales bacterium]|nr:CCA tRNA nucleotidyltransferase [Candidatus Fermentibacterales bacterium]
MARLEAARSGAGALRICRGLTESGHEARLVGGGVRDALLGLPLSDLDISTSARPEEVMACFDDARYVGRAFGVVLVRLDGISYEVSSYRTESDYADLRHPSVCLFPVTLEEDAARRDFTVNAIYFAPDSAELIDPWGGLGDLARGVLRCVGDASKRFGEDALRIMRAPRLAARLGFELEEGTRSAAASMSGLLTRLAGERVSEELDKALSDASRGDYLRLIERLGILVVLLPEVARLRGITQDPMWHPEGDALEHTVIAVEELNPLAVPDTVWCVLLHDIGKHSASRRDESGRIVSPGHAAEGAGMVPGIAARLCWPSARRQRVVWVVENHMKLMDARKMRPSTLRRLLGHRWGRDLAEVFRASRAASRRLTGADSVDPEVAFCFERIAEYDAEGGRAALTVSGSDLIDLGVPQGPEIGRLLDLLREAVENGELDADRSALLRHVRQILGKDGTDPR